MNHYRVRVQLLRWYEIIVSADSSNEAIEKAEALSPRQIQTRGKQLRIETGLADSSSVELTSDKKPEV
jgi:hypothetical protein